MAENSKIEWTHHTHNEWLGCTRISPGCKNCYASALMKRHGRIPEGYVAGSPRILTSEANRRKPFTWDRAAAKAGERRRVFAQSLSDVFDEDVADEWRDELFARMALTPHLDWLVLTKRAEKMRDWVTTPGRAGDVFERACVEAFDEETVRGRSRRLPTGAVHAPPGSGAPCGVQLINTAWPLQNVWLGVSVENQAAADERIPLLLQTPAAVRFLSVEPLLGPVDLREWVHEYPCVEAFPPIGAEPKCCATPRGLLHWVIVGGESGAGARPCDVAWIRSVVAQCKAASVPCFVKQLGAQVRGDDEWPPDTEIEDGQHYVTPRIRLRDRKGGSMPEWPEGLRVREFPAVAVSP